jgi:hypothetical protein
MLNAEWFAQLSDSKLLGVGLSRGGLVLALLLCECLSHLSLSSLLFSVSLLLQRPLSQALFNLR